MQVQQSVVKSLIVFYSTYKQFHLLLSQCICVSLALGSSLWRGLVRSRKVLQPSPCLGDPSIHVAHHYGMDITAWISRHGYHGMDTTTRISRHGYHGMDIMACISQNEYHSMRRYYCLQAQSEGLVWAPVGGRSAGTITAKQWVSVGASGPAQTNALVPMLSYFDPQTKHQQAWLIGILCKKMDCTVYQLVYHMLVIQYQLY